ncbi:MAG TPA: flap structure-specific endonuclease [Candidatus Thermoplasmatota archaeon]|nr:flap structure-specific endonuclease [Candidatus Thermoplasmatota archaeon]
MGVNLAAVLQPRPITFDDLRSKTLAFDAPTEIYPFLAIVRRGGGEHLTDPQGNVTSHLNGLLMKLTRLVGEVGARPIYVFDGPPSPRKRRVLDQRRAARAKAEEQRVQALQRGDLADAWSKAVSSTRLTHAMVQDAQRLLDLLGVPWIEAPGDAEAQAAHYAAKGVAWAAASKDFDTLLYGAPRLLRFLSFQGKEWLPSQRRFRDVPPEILELGAELARLGLTRAQLVEAALLVGTDLHEGVRGYGPKKAVAALKVWSSLDAAPGAVQDALGDWRALRDEFLAPRVVDVAPPAPRAPDPEGVVAFLVGERAFHEGRVRAALQRLAKPKAARLDDFR